MPKVLQAYRDRVAELFCGGWLFAVGRTGCHSKLSQGVLAELHKEHNGSVPDEGTCPWSCVVERNGQGFRSSGEVLSGLPGCEASSGNCTLTPLGLAKPAMATDSHRFCGPIFEQVLPDSCRCTHQMGRSRRNVANLHSSDDRVVETDLCYTWQHGIPEEMISDNGSQFISADFAEFTQTNGIRHIRSAGSDHTASSASSSSRVAPGNEIESQELSDSATQ